VPTPARSGLGTSHSGRTRKVDPSSPAAAAFALAVELELGVGVELGLEPALVPVRVYRQMMRAPSVFELEVVGEAPSASGAAHEGRSEME
jgi:hypothetical protein